MNPDNSESFERSSLDWPLDAGAADAVLQEIGRLRTVRRKRRVRVAAFAAVAVIVAACTWLNSGALKFKTSLDGSPMRRELTDGSVMELQPGTEVAVDYSAASRAITLLRGSASFDVAKHPERPFVVEAGGIQVRAVGTQFTVDLARSSVEVHVDEGRVAVELPGQGPGATRTYVSAGNRVVVDLPAKADSGAASVAVGETSQAAATALPPRIPRLDLAATPLSEVVPVFNQYSGKHLLLADPVLGSVQISGVLRADNVDALLELLQLNYGIKPERRGDSIILGKAP